MIVTTQLKIHCVNN